MRSVVSALLLLISAGHVSGGEALQRREETLNVLQLEHPRVSSESVNLHRNMLVIVK